jgi:hypothetical protein
MIDFTNKGTIWEAKLNFVFFKWLTEKTEKLKLKLIQLLNG